jgi:hypothetical protein
LREKAGRNPSGERWDAHQTVRTLLHALLRDRRTQHVAQQRLPPRRVESARPRRRVQREPIERRAQRLVVGQSLRLERREAAHPLRPGWRRLAKDRRSHEVPFGVALPVRLALVLNGPELAAPASLEFPLECPCVAQDIARGSTERRGPEMPFDLLATAMRQSDRRRDRAGRALQGRAK